MKRFWLFIALFLTIATTGHAASRYASNEILVKFKSLTKKDEAKASNFLCWKLNAKEIRRFAINNVYHMKLPKGLSVQQAIKEALKNPNVQYAEPNYILYANNIPNDPMYNQLWGMEKIQAPSAWDITTGSPQTIVAVIDSGVDYNHPDLAGNIWTGPNGEHGYDFHNNDTDPMDDNGHGTHVAGTIGAAGNNNVGITGVAWNVRIMALKFLGADGGGYTTNALRAIEYAVNNGAKITNNSYGGGGYSQAFKDAITASHNAGLLFIAAAGNEGTDNDIYPKYPAGYDVPNIISVAATDQNDNLAYFSCYGKNSVDLAAPGVSILSTKPSNQYTTKSGTSMATPHVSGVCTLIWAQNPDWTNIQVKDRLLQTVDTVPGLQGMVLTGGRLNAYKALNSGTTPPPPPPARPDIVIEPSTLPEVTLELDKTTTQTLTITNNGDSNLSFFISTNVSQTTSKNMTKQTKLKAKDYVEGELLVKFKTQKDTASIKNILAGFDIVTVKAIPEFGIYHVKLNKGRKTLEAINLLNQRIDVAYAEPNYIFRANKSPNDLLYFTQWGLHNTGAYTGTGIADVDIDAPEAWDITTGSPEIVVAVLDTGIDYIHPDLAGNIWVNPGEIPENGIDDDGNGYIDDLRGWDFINNDNNPMDDQGHGTLVSGVIGAVGNNSIGISGVCWNVKIMPLKILDHNGSGGLDSILPALAYAIRNGARVTNNSYGAHMAYGDRPLALEDAIKTANEYNQLFVAAAGNAGYDNDIIYPPEGSPLPGPNFPSSFDSPNIIAVAGSNYYDKLANSNMDNWDSNYGKTSVDLAAPGDFIWSTALDIISHNSYLYASGTSLASPFVTGACALVLSKYPELQGMQVKDMILKGIDPIQPYLGRTTLTDGRLNVYKALTQTPPPPISTSWLSITPRIGTITPTNSQQITITYNSTGLIPGTYTRIITITSNDPDTPQIELTAKLIVEDKTPPSPPTGLWANWILAEIKLRWNANTEPDMAGYNVYIRDSNTLTYTRHNSGIVQTNSYTYPELTDSNRINTYVVTAVDKYGNESAYSNAAISYIIIADPLFLWTQTSADNIDNNSQYNSMTFKSKQRLNVAGSMHSSKDAMKSFIKNIKILDEVNPYWYEMQADGTLRPYKGAKDVNLIKLAHDNNVLVIPYISNRFDPVRVSAVINSKNKTTSHIQNIVREVVTNKYDGVNIDYEDCYPKDRDAFTRFIQKLAVALHNKGKLLSISVHAKTSDQDDMDWRELAKAVDIFKVMAYDYSWKNTAGGPIAPMYWLEEVIRYALTQVPPNKLIMGIPFYGYDWSENSATTKTWLEVQDLIKTYNINPNWHNSAQEPYLEYNNHTVYYENRDSISFKLNLFTSYNIRGISIWRLGSEDPENWDAIKEHLK